MGICRSSDDVHGPGLASVVHQCLPALARREHLGAVGREARKGYFNAMALFVCDFCRRGNARNVDLNRNWPTPDWGGREAEHAITDCEPGPAPLSEPETRSIAAWASRWRPDLFLCVHSGQRKLLTPLAHSFTPPRHHAAHQRVIGALNRRLRAPLPSSSIGQASTSVGYVSRGTSLD